MGRQYVEENGHGLFKDIYNQSTGTFESEFVN
jgi:hypothetical protein